MSYHSRIASDPDILLGKPVIKGTRISIEIIIRKMSEGLSIDELLKAYPDITKEDINAALEYSADMLSNEELIGA
jgi:uncharacterized protein (DUF433 family)